MDKLEPGTMFLSSNLARTDAIIIVVKPVNRDGLNNCIANVRQMYFQDIQGPIRVLHFNPETGEERLEHIPGCATCSI